MTVLTHGLRVIHSRVPAISKTTATAVDKVNSIATNFQLSPQTGYYSHGRGFMINMVDLENKTSDVLGNLSDFLTDQPSLVFVAGIFRVGIRYAVRCE